MTDFLNPFAASRHFARGATEAWALAHPKAMRKVRIGLALVYGRICATVALTTVLIAIRLPEVAIHFAGITEIAPLWIFRFALLAWCVGLAGQVLCLAIPTESGAKTYVLASIVAEGLLFLLRFVDLRWILPADTPLAYHIVVDLVLTLLAIVPAVLFLWFVRTVAQYIGHYDLVDRTIRPLVLGAFCFPLALIAFSSEYFLALAGIVSFNALPTLVGGVASVGCLIALVMYAKLVTELRKALTV